MQCEVTQSWRHVNGKICPIISNRNRPNEYNIRYMFGKKKGQLKKNKVITSKELEQAIAEAAIRS